MIDRAGAWDPTSDRITPRASGLGSRKVVRAAFGVSVAVHAFAILIYPALARRLDPESARFPFPVFAGSPTGIEVIELVEVDVLPELERPEDPAEIARIDAAPAVVRGPSFGEPSGIELPAPGLTPAEILRPRYTDRRLWVPRLPETGELTLEQREELLLAGRLAEWQDSLDVASAAAARWTDWTFKDGNGGRWGLADGKLYLGDLAIPMPTFDAPYGQRGYMWEWNEIARQGAQGAVQESVKERIEAIRLRRDQERERERERAATEPARPLARPDSTDN